MKLFPTRTTFLEIGPLTIQWYAVCILLGTVLCYVFSKKDAKKARYIDVDEFFDNTFLLVLWVGIIGARIWYCVFYPTSYYLENPLTIIRIWDGGLAIHGGVIFGLITCFIMCKVRRISFFKVLDCIMPNVLIAQAVGRWGNFINQECHGPEVSETYFDGILFFLKDGMHIGGKYYMPMFFYESVLCIVGFLLIRYVIKRTQKRRGDLAFAYMMWYGITRLYIESLRTDSLMIGSFKIAQVISVVGIIVGVIGYLGIIEKFEKKRKPIILFDYDGTLVDTTESIIGGFEAIFKNHGKIEQFTPQVKDEIIGPPLRVMFKKYFPEIEDVEKLVDEYHEIHYELQKTTNKIYPNVKEVLDELKEKGYRMGIVSNRGKDTMDIGFEMFDLGKYFDSVIGLNEVNKTKPDPEGMHKAIKEMKAMADDVIYIGDSLGDIETGLNYGAYTIAYHSSKLRDEELNNSGANKNIYDFKELINILEEEKYFTYNGK